MRPGLLQQRRIALARTKRHRVCEETLEQRRVLVELAGIPVRQEQVAPAPVGIEALLRQFQRPVFHAKEGHGGTQVGAAFLVVGDLVERLEVGHALHRCARSLHRFAGLEQVGVDLCQQHVGHGVLVVQAAGLAQRGQCVLVAAELVVRHGRPGLGAGVAGLHHTRAQKGIQRGLRVALLEVQQPLAGECHVVRRVVAQSGGKGLARLGELVGEGFQRAQFAPGAGTLGRQRQRLLQIGAGGAGVFAFGVGTAQALPAPGVLRRELRGLGVRTQRAGGISPAAGQFSPHHRKLCMRRALCRGQRGGGLVHAVAQQLHPGQLGHQGRVRGPALQGGAQRGGRSGRVAFHEQHVRLHEPDRQRGGRRGRLAGQLFARSEDIARLQRDGSLHHGHPGCGCAAVCFRLRQRGTRGGQIAGHQRGAHRGQRFGHGFSRKVRQRVGAQGVHPLDAVARLAQHQLDRGLAHLGIGSLVGAHRHLPLRIGELHRARQHGQQGAAVVLHADVPVGAPDRRRGRRGFQVQPRAIGAARLRPGPARVEQQRGHRLGGCGHALDLQHRVLVQAQLGVVGKQQGHPRGLPGAHEIARGEGLGRASGLPVGCSGGTLVARALQADDLGGSTCGHSGLGQQRPGQGGQRGQRRERGQAMLLVGHVVGFRGRLEGHHLAQPPWRPASRNYGQPTAPTGLLRDTARLHFHEESHIS